ncbi:lipopolysaccharide heptosyltransferase family protein [Undibacterium sp. FT147W]|uniref:Lipopolysaccharide heptosyltransferase family protein n=1 Tax=Undibacterium rivi TaxID=2828729 RepID=A0ABS5H1W3_9BURK|nr:glycosyltransferase family 9 protein [Undibacterium rivi]MBR7792680.1 lipopolysaccharide heptosyltransferase family protein [Undibacterium rivi]
MSTQQIPADLLKKTKKILFIAPLAIGDFSYLQNSFKAFSQTYPHIEMHLWVDELRRTRDERQWPFLEKYALYDWVSDCDLFSKVYRRTYSPALLAESIQEAKDEEYPIVVSLSILRPQQYASLARKLSPHGYVAGIKHPVSLLKLHHLVAYKKLDAAIQENRFQGQQVHISTIYADWFNQAFGIESKEADLFPYVNIPKQWLQQARFQLEEWGFDKTKSKVVFINPFAKINKRCWPLSKVAELIKAMQGMKAWRGACFVVSAPPEKLAQTQASLKEYKLKNTQFFSAQDNFFELPAMLSWCDLIISVETAVMHLANAVHVPVIALMRQKNPEWAPFDQVHSKVITSTHRHDWVDAISVDNVIAQLSHCVKPEIQEEALAF